MQPQEFCYWLQGFAELNGSKPTTQQWEMIKEHLNLVFSKVTVLNIYNKTYQSWGETGCGYAPINLKYPITRESITGFGIPYTC